jgi:uncharacterized protein
MLKKSLVVTVITFFVASSALAGFDEGIAAYKRSDYALAMQEWKPLAEEGNAGAQNNLGVMYLNGRGVQKDAVQAVQWFRKAAEQGNSDSQTALGVMYRNGVGVLPDYPQAVMWLRKGAVKNVNAQLILAEMYLNGDNVQKNITTSVELYELAANQGNADAQYSLGVIYRDGSGVVQSYQEAMKWFQAAAQSGHALAQYSLGLLFRSGGQGIRRNDKEAVVWYRKAAEQGYAQAESELGYMYEIGAGVKKDDKESVKWWLKAGEQGYVSARHSLGDFFMTPKPEKLYGINAEKSLVVAYALHNLNTDYFPSQQKISMLAGGVLSAAEIAEAKALTLQLAQSGNFINALNQYIQQFTTKNRSKRK